MTYLETVNWMFSQLPMYQRQGKSAYKSDLTNTIKLADHLGNPEDGLLCVHVAGTNGKGSTSHMLASVLQEAGYRVGLYTSPHLKDFRERIRINGKTISKQFVIGFIKRNRDFLERNSLSFFEMTVLMAFEYFNRKEIDLAIIEVGLGGRLDSTNIVTPLVSVITNIGMDHTQFLGNDLKEIAVEKAGIIKDGVPVVIGETQNETKAVFENKAKSHGAKIVFADSKDIMMYSSDLIGSYQSKNIKTVVQTIKELRELGFKISEEQLASGLEKVVVNTGLKGRWQVLSEAPKVICDVAHNKEGLVHTLEQINSVDKNQLHIVLGFVSDKDVLSLVPLFPKEALYYFCKPEIPRGMDASELGMIFKGQGRHGNVYKNVAMAFDQAKRNANEDDVIYIGGSTFVVAEIL